MDLLCFCSVLCLLCLCARLFICALRSPAVKGLTSLLSFVVSNCEFVTFFIGILGQMWYLIVSISDLCTLTHLHKRLLLVYQHISMTSCRRSQKASPSLSTNIYDQITLTFIKRKH